MQRTDLLTACARNNLSHPAVALALDAISYTAATYLEGDGANLSEEMSELFALSNAYQAVVAVILHNAKPAKDKEPTLAEVKEWCAKAGCTVRRVDGEYRVCRKGAPEVEAYYTDDAQDAIDTAFAIESQYQAYQNTLAVRDCQSQLAAARIRELTWHAPKR